VVLMVFVDVPGDAAFTPTQFRHVGWEGLHLADFVFPGFLVAAGAAIGLASRPAPVGKVVWRAARLFAIGLVLVWIDSGRISFESGTLQLIAVAWMLGAFATRVPPRWRVAVAAALLGGSVAIHHGGWTDGGLESTIDSAVFGEQSDLGILCMINASVAVMLASVVTQTTKGRAVGTRITALLVLALGCGLSGGLMWALGAPAVKRIWSPSYVLLTVAGCAVVWAVLEWLLPEPRWWSQPFVALGRNALAAFVAMSLIGSLVPESVSHGFVDAFSGLFGSSFASVLWSLLVVVLLAAAAEALSRRDVVIRI
jgi:predicted acyltransferase